MSILSREYTFKAHRFHGIPDYLTRQDIAQPLHHPECVRFSGLPTQPGSEML
jgi:hypothetical protein